MGQIPYGIITNPSLIEFPAEQPTMHMKSNVEEIIEISGRRCLDERLKRQYDDKMIEIDDICKQETGLTLDNVCDKLLEDALYSLTTNSNSELPLKKQSK